MPKSAVPKAGVIGWPVGHSLSPCVHGFWLKKYGLSGSYEALAIEPQGLKAALRGLKASGFVGVNLTIPHKEAAFGLVDARNAVAERIGSLNLVIVDKQGKLFGRNTDAYGFEQNLSQGGFKKESGLALVLGAGGACRAVLVALQNMGFSEIRLANRTKEHAEKLARELQTSSTHISVVDWDKAPSALPGIDLLVNTTSLGMEGQLELALPLDALPASATVTDLVYAPLETGLLKEATRRGNRTIDGLGMLLHQARPSFEAFFGRDPEVTQELRNAVLAGKAKC